MWSLTCNYIQSSVYIADMQPHSTLEQSAVRAPFLCHATVWYLPAFSNEVETNSIAVILLQEIFLLPFIWEDGSSLCVEPKVTANQVANQLLLNGKSRKIKNKIKFKLNRKKYSKDPGHTRPMTMEELEKGISTLKPGKAIGLDNISTEQIKNFGPVTKKWLLQLYNHCLTTHKLPKIWKKAHVIALLKPGKDPSIPKSYRPISLLSHTYKLFERLLLNRIGPVVDKLLIPEQAGFRPGKSTTSQVLNLTQHIEDGFEIGMVW